MTHSSKEIAEMVRQLKDTLPSQLLERHFKADPSLKDKYGDKQKQLYLQDTKYHLSYLSESISAGAPVLFNEYLGWAKTFLKIYPLPMKKLLRTSNC